MSHIITYISDDYMELESLTVNGWEKHYPVTVVRDFGKDATFPASNDWREKTERKIKSILLHYNEMPDTFAWVDADCIIKDRFDECFLSDITCTRMLNRDNRSCNDINSGVIFFRKSGRTQTFLKEWYGLTLALRNSGKHLHEQHAFHQLCMAGFDRLKPWSVSCVSEYVYNCEHDDNLKWFELINTYKPKIIHMKGQRWQKEEIRQRFGLY